MIVSPRRSTAIAQNGAVSSAQSAELTVSQADLDRLWNPTNLENLARTYWQFLSRVTLGLIRVVYGEHERRVVFLIRSLTLLRFDPPVYVIEEDHGRVSWRIRGRPAGGSRRARFGIAGARRAPPAAGPRLAGQSQAEDRGRGDQLLSLDRRRFQHAGVQGHPVGDPRAGHPCVPALAGRTWSWRSHGSGASPRLAEPRTETTTREPLSRSERR